MNKKGLFNLLRIVISGGLLAFLIWMMRDSFGQVLETIKKADRVTISAGFLVFLAGMMLLGVRLHVIMKSQNIHLPLGRVIYLTFIGQFFSNFLPTAIGGDIVKAFYAARHTGKKLLTVTCIIMDRILGTATIILMLLIVSFFVSESIVNKALFSFLIIAVSGSAVFFIVLFSKKVARRIPFIDPILRKFNLLEKVKDLYGVLHNYRNHPVLLLNAVGLSLLLQAIMYCSVYLIAHSLSFSVPLAKIFLFMPIISTMSMAPSINGLGVREGGFVLFFGPLLGKENAFALGIMWLAVNLAASLIGGLLYLFVEKKGGLK